MRFVYSVMIKMVQNEEFIRFAYNELRLTALESESDTDSLKLIFDLYVTGNRNYEITYTKLANELMLTV